MFTQNDRQMVEQLEERRLLSAVLLNGVLTVKATTGDDSVVVSLAEGDATHLAVNVNGTVTTFDVSAVKSIVAYGSSGNDSMKVDNLFGIVPFGVCFKGGDGNDLLIGGNRVDQLLGGLGDDELRGMSGNDFLDGSDGLDKLLGYAGNDEILGGIGNDLIEGGSGNDLLKGGLGDDLLKGGNGLDSLLGNDGIDHLFGELDADFLDGGTGDDFLDGGAAIDKLVGGLGSDTFSWDHLVELVDNGINDVLDHVS
jgi:Ca2+-binding RTX toxin-like protein